MDEELFLLLDGTPVSGAGGYTSQSIREAWRRRVEQRLPWGQTAGHADTTEAIERTLAIAVGYALNPTQIPAAYYLAARIHDDFESSVLHAINGGGQIQAWAILTGALTGAQTGFSDIPQRFIVGLQEATLFCKLAEDLASQADQIL